MQDDVPYCKADFMRLFAEKCYGCKEPVSGNIINAIGHKWHPQCFKCRVRAAHSLTHSRTHPLTRSLTPGARAQFCEDKIEASYVPSDDGYPTCPKPDCKVRLVQMRREEKTKQMDAEVPARTE